MRTNSPRLVNPALVHDKHFAGQIGIETPATIGARQGELAAEKQQLVKAPVVGGALTDNTAAKSLLTTLHTAGIITDQTDEGFSDPVPYHDVNAGNFITTSETIDTTMEVRRYNVNAGPDIVVTLPKLSDVAPGKIFTFQRIDRSGFRVTITAFSTDLINQARTYDLMGAMSSITIMSSAVQVWMIISRSDGYLRWIETVPSVSGTFSAGAISANTAYLTRVRIDNPITVYYATYALGGTGGAFNIDLGVYYSDGTTLTRLGSTGSTVLGSINALTTNTVVGLPPLFPGMDYYIGLVCDSATPLIYKVLGTQLLTFYRSQVVAFTASFPLPPTLTLASGLQTTNQPWIMLEAL